MSPTQRTLAECRKRGWVAHVVEKWNQYAHIRQDFGGFADIIAYAPDIGVLAIQTTTGGNHAARRQKSCENINLRSWLAAKAGFAIWSWSKKGARGKRKVWVLREESL